MNNIIADPGVLADVLQRSAGPLQRTYPMTALEYGNGLTRQLLVIKAALGSLPNSAQSGSLQPALERDLPNASARDFERVGLMVAAATEPLRTMQEMLQGAAGPEQVEVFKHVHPMLYQHLIGAIVRHLSTYQKPLTDHQRTVLALLGIPDPSVPVGFLMRAQQKYAQDKMPVQGSRAGLSAASMSGLQRTGDVYGTRETRRAAGETA